MTTDYSVTLLVDKTPEETFEAINNVPAWWSQDFEGASQNPGDEFFVRFQDIHYSGQRLTDIVPGKKIVWLVTHSNLSFLSDPSEWEGTTIIFDITEEDGQTKVQFTHQGLQPQIQCFRDCSNGWNYYLQQSLLPYINTGEGKPNVKE